LCRGFVVQLSTLLTACNEVSTELSPLSVEIDNKFINSFRSATLQPVLTNFIPFIGEFELKSIRLVLNEKFLDSVT
jgi:hypothetical protein